MLTSAISVSLSALLYYILPLGWGEHYGCVVQKQNSALVRIVSGSCCYLLDLNFFNTSSYKSLALYLTHQFVDSEPYLPQHWLGWAIDLLVQQPGTPAQMFGEAELQFQQFSLHFFKSGGQFRLFKKKIYIYMYAFLFFPPLKHSRVLFY